MVEVIEDPLLGRLTYDDAGEWYEGKADITPGRSALVYVCPEPDVTDGPTAVRTARDTLVRLRCADAELRRAAAVELAASYPERVSPFAVEQIAAALWAGVVYFWDDGGSRVDWDAEPPVLGSHSCNWTTRVDPTGRATESGWA